jgi:hypothetical protein
MPITAIDILDQAIEEKRYEPTNREKAIQAKYGKNWCFG